MYTPVCMVLCILGVMLECILSVCFLQCLEDALPKLPPPVLYDLEAKEHLHQACKKHDLDNVHGCASIEIQLCKCE